MATPTSNGVISFFGPSFVNNIDAMLGGSKWGGSRGTAATVTFSFAGDNSFYSTSSSTGYGSSLGDGEPWNGWATLTAAQEAAVQKALNAWSAVARINFVEVTDSFTVAGDIRFAYSDAVSFGANAHAYSPSATAKAGDVWLSPSIDGADFSLGSGAYFTVLHEIGHAAMGLIDVTTFFGLNGADLSDVFENNAFTVMSYEGYEGDITPGTDVFDDEDHPTTPMWFDIQAAQYVYGANTSYHSGNNVYKWAVGQKIYMTLWDGGGIDTIDWSNQASAAKINLNTGVWNDLGPTLNLGDGVTSTDTLIIYQGVVIENAKGGSGADTIVGNSNANVLSGNAGSDVVSGGSGNDRLFGGTGNDRLSGGGGGDIHVGGKGVDVLTGGAGSDVFRYVALLDGGFVATNVSKTTAGVSGDRVKDFTHGSDHLQFENTAFDPQGDIGLGGLTLGIDFSVISGTYKGTNAGNNANFADKDATFVFSTADDTLYYDANGSNAGYTVIATFTDGDNPVAGDIQIV